MTEEEEFMSKEEGVEERSYLPAIIIGMLLISIVSFGAGRVSTDKVSLKGNQSIQELCLERIGKKYGLNCRIKEKKIKWYSSTKKEVLICDLKEVKNEYEMCSGENLD